MSVLVTIEGIDGSGKGTQATRLVEAMRMSGRRCELLSFPRYRETEFGRKIGDFLNGRFGQLDQVNPFLVSLLFAGDRLESKPILLQALSENDLVVCDRYVASNVAHQGAKVNLKDRKELTAWIHHVEHALYGLPHPDRTLFLNLPVQRAAELIALKSQRTYTERVADIQEADADYLQQVHDIYMELSASNSNWHRIDCLDGNELKSVDQIATEVWNQALSVVGDTPC